MTTEPTIPQSANPEYWTKEEIMKAYRESEQREAMLRKALEEISERGSCFNCGYDGDFLSIQAIAKAALAEGGQG